ncbi:MAG TPA: YigZ family protein [Ginsengibacter sp.]|nr:YigZ family protein [Ginsengibacter sp.]HRP18373.1 YigZ family protein [Ginsengibacter sp.]
MKSYLTIGQEATAEFKMLESKFIAYAYPITNTATFKVRLDDLRRLHPKASHHCFAYRLGTDGSNSRANDDGEPSGTAGRPILGQIDSRNLTDTLVIVVRYFGGTLLGIPRLTNSYKTAASLVLQCTTTVEKYILRNVSIECSYAELHEVIQILKQSQSEITEQELQLFCHIKAGIPAPSFDEIVDQLHRINNVIVHESIKSIR